MSGGLSLVQPPLSLALNAQKLLRAAARGVSPIDGALSVAPTFSQGATNAASSLNAAVAVATTSTNVAAGSFAANDTNYIEQIGGPLLYNGSSGYLGDAVINVLATPTRQGGHGMGIRFVLPPDALAFEVGMQNSGSPCIGYSTDPRTRLRQRFQAADQAVTTGLSYCKWTFGSAPGSIIELYPIPFTRLTNIVVGAGKMISRSSLADDPVIAMLADSWGNGTTLGGATNGLKLAMLDFLGERFGTANPISSSVSSTGLLGGANVATSGTYRQRIAAGDITYTRTGVGNYTLLFLGGSLNDQAFTDNQRGTEYGLTLEAAKIAQPTAIICGHGPQYTTSTPTAQATYDAHKAAAIAAGFSVWTGGSFSNLGTDPRLFYIDNSPAGMAWLNANNVSLYTDTTSGHDGNHLNNAGCIYYAYTIANALIAAVKARNSL